MKIAKLMAPVVVCLFVSLIAVFGQQTEAPDKQTNAAPAVSDYRFPNAEKRFRRYLGDTVGAGALTGIGIGAIFQQIDNEPPEWKKNGKGFARRLGSNFGQNAIEETTKYALSEAFGQDQKYRKCDCTKLSSRAFYALKSGFTARNRSGKQVFSLPKLVSPFVGSVAAVKLWYPKRYSVQDGMRRGAYGFLFSVGFNLVQEFIFKKK